MIDTTRLLRNSPFGEWVNVFYDPTQTDTDTLLQLIKKRNCPGATHTTDANGKLLNPVIAPGDPIQIKMAATKSQDVSAESQLPRGWQFVDAVVNANGEQVVTLSTPAASPNGNTSFVVQFESGEKVTAEVAVVRQVGSH